MGIVAELNLGIKFWLVLANTSIPMIQEHPTFHLFLALDETLHDEQGRPIVVLHEMSEKQIVERALSCDHGN